MYYNEEFECKTRESLRTWQSRELPGLIQRIYENVPIYRAKMDAAGIVPADIKSVGDLHRLPFTTKQDLRDSFPYGMFAVPMEKVVRIHASSGTTGKQTVVGYTKADIEIWSVAMARALTAMGVTKDSIIHNSYGYGLFTGGFGVHYGAEALGAAVIPVSGGNSKRQIQIMKDFGSTFLACTPSYALSLAETMAEMGYTKDDLNLAGGTFGAEPWTENMRREIEDRLGIKAYDIYGLSEIMGPAVSYECEHQAGMHINEDLFIPEIIDPDTGEVLPEGAQGELVFTTLTKEAFPLIRYRTRDIASLIYDKCKCGRTFVRMSKPKGRSDDMLIIRGVNVFPSQIESVLLQIEETTANYQIIVDRMGQKDFMEVLVEISPEIFFDEVRKLEDIKRKIQAAIESTLGLSAKVTLVEPKSITRSEGKAVRVVDKRVLY